MLYQYKCKEHGVFEVRKPMSDCSKPAYCPQCNKEGRRIFNALAVTWGKSCWNFDNEGLGDNVVLSHH